MPSSISSSDPLNRAPDYRWGVVWFGVIAITLLLLGGAEAFWRSRGLKPMPVDDPALWARERRKASIDESERVVALLGSSRMQLDFSTAVFHERYPNFIIANLAINGQAPIATLKNLAEDERFRGVVLCSLRADAFLPEFWADQQSHINSYENATFYDGLETSIRLFFQQRLNVISPTVAPKRVLANLARGQGLPSTEYLTTLSDRSRLADYSKVDIEPFKRERIERFEALRRDFVMPPAKEWARSVEAVDRYVQAIQARGGKVAFIRFPTTDEYWKSDQQFFPKEAYWDQLAKHTSADAVIHFLDTPGMSNFDCPDTSHLDQKDAPAFTNALLDELVRRGLLPASN